MHIEIMLAGMHLNGVSKPQKQRSYNNRQNNNGNLIAHL